MMELTQKEYVEQLTRYHEELQVKLFYFFSVVALLIIF